MIARADVLALVAFLLSAAAVGVVRWYAIRRDVLDHPNARSSHARPTPRGGGLGLLIAVGLALGLLTVPLPRAMWVALAGVACVAGVGWWDDHGGLSVRLRLAVHVIAGLLMIPLVLLGYSGAPWLLALLAAGWVLITVSSINVVNFIDGIDGMIGAQALVFGASCWWLGASAGASASAGVGAALAGAALGFLVWNWAPARIFLGDVGSGALGVLFVAAGLLLAAEGGLDPVLALLPLAPIFLDATVTLVRRARRGERLTESHRSHLYQRLANGGWGHARVSLLYAAAAAAAIPAAATQRWSWAAAYLGAAAVGYLLLDRTVRAAGT